MDLRNIRSARERVLQNLWLRAGHHGRSIAIEGQLQDIAAEVGMTREALDRTLAALLTALEAEGFITWTKTASADLPNRSAQTPRPGNLGPRTPPSGPG